MSLQGEPTKAGTSDITASTPLAGLVNTAASPELQGRDSAESNAANRWGPPVFALLFLALGSVLRLYNFWKPELWIDEYGTWWTVAGSDWMDVAHRALHIQGQSPFYYLLVRLCTDVLGTSPFSLRLPSIIPGIGLIALAYPLGLRLFKDRHAAMLSVAAFSVNVPLIFYSLDARPYSLALFFTMLSFFWYLSLLEREKLSVRIAYLLATSGLFYAHYLFSLAVGVQAVHLLLARRGAAVRSKAWLATLAGVALLWLPGVVQLSRLFGRRDALGWIDPSMDVREFAALTLSFADPMVFAMVALAVLVAGIDPARAEPGWNTRNRMLILLWFLGPIAVTYMVPPLFGVTLSHHRYVLLSAPAALFTLVLLMRLGRTTGIRRWVPIFVLMSLTFMVLLPTFKDHGVFAPLTNQGWTQAARVLEERGQPGDLMLYRSGFVEADSVETGIPDPMLVSFVDWPLQSHLASFGKFHVIHLPYRLTGRFLSAAIDQIQTHPRIWVVGFGPTIIPTLIDTVSEMEGLATVVREDFGEVKIGLLDRNVVPSGSGLIQPRHNQ